MDNSREMTDSQLIAELERRRALKPTLNVRVDFGSSLKFWLAYLSVSVIAWLVVAIIVLLIIRTTFPGIGTLLSHYGLIIWNTRIKSLL